MSGQLKYLRGRIKSLKSTTKITKAMQLVSSSKYRVFAKKIASANSYLTELEKLGRATKHWDKFTDFECKFRNLLYGHVKSDLDLLIVFSPSRGLCGNVNTQLQKFVNSHIQSFKAENLQIVTVGNKISDYLARRYSDMNISNYNHNNYLQKINELISNIEYRSIQIIYTNCVSIMKYSPVLLKNFPLQNIQDEIGDDHHMYDILIEPDKDVAIRAYLSLAFNSTLQIASLHSETSEHAGRMVAMDSATKNGNNMMFNLNILSNKIRQANITRDLIDIVSGAQVVN